MPNPSQIEKIREQKPNTMLRVVGAYERESDVLQLMQHNLVNADV